jgi:hypothetical protein
MPKHDPRVQNTYFDTKKEMDELCDLWNDKGGEDYLKNINCGDLNMLWRVSGMMASRLASLVVDHSRSQYARDKPNYWPGMHNRKSGRKGA